MELDYYETIDLHLSEARELQNRVQDLKLQRRPWQLPTIEKDLESLVSAFEEMASEPNTASNFIEIGEVLLRRLDDLVTALEGVVP